MDRIATAFDIGILLASAASAWLWFRASAGRVRRVSYRETIDAADLNRLVVALNRNMLLNRRAALATGLVAALAALRVLLGMLTG